MMKHAPTKKLHFFVFFSRALLLVLTQVHAEVRPAFDATVNNVADGDTFTLLGTSHRIPVWGLDAPD